ncbi:Toluene efflux pump periplasmic linker protein TtgA [Thalassocella blandensis]|nr:Toluene efflux pump periplasmic linker protein TtgA [Thalassocella blandensis]
MIGNPHDNNYRGIFVTCFLIFTLVATTGCNQSDSEKLDTAPLRFVKTHTVSDGNAVEWREFPGQVAASQTADLGFRISGKLQELLVREGDIVEKDQVIAKLEMTDITIQLNKAEAEYEQIHADFERGKILADKGVISRSDYEKLSVQDSSALANLQAAKQNKEYSSLRAPFKGRIAKRWADNFEEVSAMQKVVTLQDISSINIEVSVPESVMINVQENETPKVVARFDAIPDREFPLQLKEVATQADELTNTFEVTLVMGNIPGYNILPGMSVTVRGERQFRTSDNGEDAIFIPAQAVLDDGKERYVYIAEPQEGDNLAIVKKQVVSTGKLSSVGLEILSGVKAGDKIVIAGMSKMSDGLRVKLQ